MATQKDVAKLAGVSRVSVSNYINNKGYVGAKAKKRIEQAIKELNYTPNILARSLKSRRSNTIGVLFPEVDNSFPSSIIRNVERVARSNGYNIILCITENDPQKELNYIESLKNWFVDGFIINPTKELNANPYEELSGENVVYVHRCSKLEDSDKVCVKLDNYEGVKLGLEYLLELGHRNIGVIRGPGTITTGSERYEHLIGLMKQHGIPLREEFIATAPDYTEQNGYITTRALLHRGSLPTAIFSLCGGLSIGSLKAIKESGLCIPDDISFISFDNSNYTEYLDPPLTTIMQPVAEFGITAINSLLRMIQGHPSDQKLIELPPELIIRNSCIQSSPLTK